MRREAPPAMEGAVSLKPQLLASESSSTIRGSGSTKGSMMAEAQKPARDATWDIARGIGMMLVISAGHLLEPIYPANPVLGRPLV